MFTRPGDALQITAIPAQGQGQFGCLDCLINNIQAVQSPLYLVGGTYKCPGHALEQINKPIFTQ